jgi:alpha-beta hydrolase superfamily lysophospholipase
MVRARRSFSSTAASPTATIGANQVPAVAARHTLILMDSRGHGRSTRDARPYGYDLMADVVALMDALKIPKADIVGWSDGGIIGIDVALSSTSPSAISSATNDEMSPAPLAREIAVSGLSEWL